MTTRSARSDARTFAVAATLAGGLLLAGCASPFGPGDTGWRSRADQLARIAADDLSAYAISPAESVDEGVERLGSRLEAEDLVAAAGPLPESMPVSLADVRAAALRHNLDLRVERFNPRTAAERVREEAAAFEAVFAGSVRWARTDQPVALATESTQN